MMASCHSPTVNWLGCYQLVSLEKEAFVQETDLLIDAATQHIPNAEAGFELTFSDAPFDGYQLQYQWRRADTSEQGGNFYYSPDYDIESNKYTYYDGKRHYLYEGSHPHAHKPFRE